jgi:hypothetical protein
VTRNLAFVLAAGAAAFALIGAAQLPTGLAQAQPGLWEISGVPGTAAPVRQCVPDIAQLARFEHRAKNCSLSAGATGEVDDSCGPAGFGHSQVTLLTPRALRIATQGISNGAPFNYVLQARRIGDCVATARH